MTRFVPGYFEHVYYHRTPPITTYPAIAGDIAVDVAIIGLGAAGLAAARSLGQQLEGTGARILGIEAGKIGRSGAAGRNGGWPQWRPDSELSG